MTATLRLPALALLGVGTACYPRLEISIPSGDLGTDSGVGGDGGADGGGDGGGHLELDSLLPTDGPTSGASTVEIVGGPFDDSAQVYFGDAAADIQTIDSDRIGVLAPSFGTPGWVDVRVQQSDRSGTLPDAYHYWEDADGDAIMLGTWMQVSVANDSTWIEGPPTFEGWLRFIHPFDAYAYQRYGVIMDTCADQDDPLSSLRGPDELMLGYSGDELSFTWSDSRQEYAYQASGIPTLEEDAALVLDASRSDLNPPLALTEAARTPERIDVLSPALGSADIPELKYDDATITWTAGGYGHVMIIVGSDDSSDFMCMASDDGSLTIPTSQLDKLDWASGSTEVWMAIVGMQSRDTYLPWINGSARIDAGLGLIGRVRVSGKTSRVTP